MRIREAMWDATGTSLASSLFVLCNVVVSIVIGLEYKDSELE